MASKKKKKMEANIGEPWKTLTLLKGWCWDPGTGGDGDRGGKKRISSPGTPGFGVPSSSPVLSPFLFLLHHSLSPRYQLPRKLIHSRGLLTLTMGHNPDLDSSGTAG